MRDEVEITDEARAEFARFMGSFAGRHGELALIGLCMFVVQRAQDSGADAVLGVKERK